MTSGGSLVAIVTGASRGVGRGIAQALGEAGATVHLTGRTIGRAGDVPGLEAVAAEVRARGGSPVIHQVDHRDDSEVEAVFDEVSERDGCLDLLVNNAFGTPEPWISGGGIWEHPAEIFDGMFDVGVRSSYIAARYACRLMVPAGSGTIVNISSHAAREYLFSTAYGMAKAAADKLSADLAVEVAPHGMCVVSLWPGLVRTEFYLQQVQRGLWPERPDAQEPVEVGRAILNLLEDPRRLTLSGSSLRVSDLLSSKESRQ